eukprot:scaffold327_cov257-Pinguiococcus_pyrenoidosus.AAC.29
MVAQCVRKCYARSVLQTVVSQLQRCKSHVLLQCLGERCTDVAAQSIASQVQRFCFDGISGSKRRRVRPSRLLESQCS